MRTKGWRKTPSGAAVVIMDVTNGEILALVSQPTYDTPISLIPFPSVGREAAAAVRLERAAGG